MKKIILLVTAVLSVLADNSFGQGTINFANNASTLVLTNNDFTHQIGPAPLTTGSGIKIQLVYQSAPPGSLAPVAVDLNNGALGNWKPIANLASISPLVGRFNGGQVTTGNDVAPAGNVWLQVLGWNNSAYSTFADAIAAGVGQNGNNLQVGTSVVWKQGTGDGNSIAAPNIALSGFTGLQLFLPEPSPLELGCLGGAVIMLSRWAKNRKIKPNTSQTK